MRRPSSRNGYPEHPNKPRQIPSHSQASGASDSLGREGFRYKMRNRSSRYASKHGEELTNRFPLSIQQKMQTIDSQACRYPRKSSHRSSDDCVKNKKFNNSSSSTGAQSEYPTPNISRCSSSRASTARGHTDNEQAEQQSSRCFIPQSRISDVASQHNNFIKNPSDRPGTFRRDFSRPGCAPSENGRSTEQNLNRERHFDAWHDEYARDSPHRVKIKPFTGSLHNGNLQRPGQRMNEDRLPSSQANENGHNPEQKFNMDPLPSELRNWMACDSEDRTKTERFSNERRDENMYRNDNRDKNSAEFYQRDQGGAIENSRYPNQRMNMDQRPDSRRNENVRYAEQRMNRLNSPKRDGYSSANSPPYRNFSPDNSVGYPASDGSRRNGHGHTVGRY